MNFNFYELFLSKPFLGAIIAQMTAQIFKIFLPLLRGKKVDAMNFFSYGDIPSAHTAFIIGVSFGIGLQEGWGSATFALAVVVTSIIIYDIIKLRTAVEINLKYTQRLMDHNQLPMDEKMPQFKGHSILEVVTGAVWGILWALIVFNIPIGK
jgi:acid phosphatase family membrane protein YuiD